MQIAIWENANPVRGPKSPKPWGCPYGAWDSYARQKRRGGNPSLADLIVRRSSRPWWISPNEWTAKDRPGEAREGSRWWEPPHEPRLEKEVAKISTEDKVIFAAATASAATKALIEGGRFPGVRWVPGVGGVRTIIRRTVGC